MHRLGAARAQRRNKTMGSTSIMDREERPSCPARDLCKAAGCAVLGRSRESRLKDGVEEKTERLFITFARPVETSASATSRSSELLMSCRNWFHVARPI